MADSYSIEPESESELEPRSGPHDRLLSSDESNLDTDIEKHNPSPSPLVINQSNTPRYGHIVRLLLPFLTGILLTLLATHLPSTISTSTNTNIPSNLPKPNFNSKPNSNTTLTTLLHIPAASTSTDSNLHVPSTWLSGPCGPSPSHARSQSCHFSRILHAWLPPWCITASDLADEIEMHSLYTFDWWGDASHREALSLEDVMSGERETVYTGVEWHVVHCVYAWKRMSRSLVGDGAVLDSVVAALEHTDHCGRVILGWEELRAKGVGSRVVRKFPECGGGWDRERSRIDRKT